MGASRFRWCEWATGAIITVIMTMVTAVTVLDHWDRDINWIVIALAFYFNDLRW